MLNMLITFILVVKLWHQLRTDLWLALLWFMSHKGKYLITSPWDAPHQGCCQQIQYLLYTTVQKHQTNPPSPDQWQPCILHVGYISQCISMKGGTDFLMTHTHGVKIIEVKWNDVTKGKRNGHSAVKSKPVQWSEKHGKQVWKIVDEILHSQSSKPPVLKVIV